MALVPGTEPTALPVAKIVATAKKSVLVHIQHVSVLSFQTSSHALLVDGVCVSGLTLAAGAAEDASQDRVPPLVVVPLPFRRMPL